VTDRVYDGKPIGQDRDQDRNQQGVAQSAFVEKEFCLSNGHTDQSIDLANLRIDNHNNGSQCRVERISLREAEITTSDCGTQVSIQLPAIIVDN
jgi:hypothetical protein